MSSCFKLGLNIAKEFLDSGEEKGKLPSLLAGSNIAGFCKVVAAMHAIGGSCQRCGVPSLFPAIFRL